MAKQQFFSGVHALRAVAAMLVVFQHAYFHAFNDPRLYSNEFPINYGRLGVAVFFSITGFLIMRGRTKPIGQFIFHRVARIYPIFWITIAVTAAALYIVGRHALPTWQAAFLFPSTSGSALAIPYWTLVYEVAFYTAATILFCFRLPDRWLTAIVLLWILVINVLTTQDGDLSQLTFPGWWILFSPITQVIAMGCLLALHFERAQKINPLVWLGIALVAFAVSYLFPDPTAHRHFFLGIATTSIVAAACRVRSPANWLVSVGYASYGLYLLHWAVMEFEKPFFLHLTFTAQLLIYLITATVIGTAFGGFDYWLYNRLIAFSKSISDKMAVQHELPGSRF